MSAPRSNGHYARDTTTFSYFDNGWVRSSEDAWDITTSYDYNELGQQTARTLTGAAGSSSRTMSWSFYPDGKLAGRSDDGVPVGLDVVLVDNTDYQNTEMEPTWSGSSNIDGYIGPGYRWVDAGDGSSTFTWNLTIPADGDYEVFVNYTATTNRATDAPYTITHDGGQDTLRVDQQTGGGEWQSLGTYAFSQGGDHSIVLSDDANGLVAADAVKLVRDNSGETDTEAKGFGYGYDANGNLVEITDSSSDADVDTYAVSYTGLNQVATVEELNSGSVVNTTSYSYDVNGNPLTRAHDDAHAEYAYDVRDLVEQVTNGDAAGDPDARVTSFSYTPNGWTSQQVKPNGNTVAMDYYKDGLLRHKLESKPDGTVVAEHTLNYDANRNRTEDVARTLDADQAGVYSDRTYDPRDRIAEVVKTDTSSGATLSTESYVHDASSNLVSQTLEGVTTSYTYDRNRLLYAETSGVRATYNYDAFGRIDTVTAAGEVIERYTYDGFDRVAEHTSIDDTGTTSTTAYSYDPLDRTAARTDNLGDTDEETREFDYLGLSGDVLNEEVAGELQKSYHYSRGASGCRR